MTSDIIVRLNYGPACELHEAYTRIIQTYEDAYGGPRACRGIPEYHAAISSAEKCLQRIRAIEQWTKTQL